MEHSNRPYGGYNGKNLGRARSLRREMTKQEKHLWYDFLKAYPVHVYKQRPIDHYIADFFIDAAKLVIELDGDQHGEGPARQYDKIRTEHLKGYGLEVLRLTNSEVDRSFESVCHTIHETVKERLWLLGNVESLQKLEEQEKSWDAYAK